MYVRFVVAERDERSQEWRGIVTALYALERRGELAEHELRWFREAEAWLNAHLARPARLAGSRRPNAPERAISWLKMTAVEHVRRLRELAAILEEKAIPVQELRTERPGYVVYEDAHQVAAIPFPGETFE